MVFYYIEVAIKIIKHSRLCVLVVFTTAKDLRVYDLGPLHVINSLLCTDSGGLLLYGTIRGNKI